MSRRLGRLSYGVLSSERIRANSVARIHNVNARTKDGPALEGVYDRRMGTVERTLPCQTCDGSMMDCPGHWGHLELPFACWNPTHMATLTKLFQCLCFHCSNVLLTPHNDARVKALISNHHHHQSSSELVLREYAYLCRQRDQCRHEFCGKKTPKVRYDNFTFYFQDRDEPFYPLLAYTILSRVPHEQLQWLGFDTRHTHPKDMVFHDLPVPPPIMRPPVVTERGTRGDDDITRRLCDIIRTRNQVAKQVALVKFGISLMLDGLSEPQLDDEGGSSLTASPFLTNSSKRRRVQVTQPGSTSNVRSTPRLKTRAAGSDPGNAEAFTKVDVFNAWLALQLDIVGYFQDDSKIRTLVKRSSRQQRLQCLLDRFRGGKTGRVRGNLMGKRTDFSARSVIVPDPYLALDQLGVPCREIAMVLTKSEVVTRHNHAKLTQLVRNGPGKWPGARFIVRKEDTDDNRRGGEDSRNTRIDLRVPHEQSELVLRLGDTVERHLQDDERDIFNRQPSLHRMSWMGLRIVVYPERAGSAFGLNPAICGPFNADFDGDEMNLHACQTMEARVEVEELMRVCDLITSEQSNQPVIGLAQDAVLGCYLLSKHNPTFERDEWYQLLFECGLDEEWTERKGESNGRTLLSMALPRTLQVDVNNFAIRDGLLVEGVLDKRWIGTSAGGLIHRIWLDHGPQQCQRTVERLQTVAYKWLNHYGMTATLRDCEIDAETDRAIDRLMAGVSDIHENDEGLLNDRLNAVSMEAGQMAARTLDKQNAFHEMIVSGAKGSKLNLAQIVGCVGQQNVSGQRIARQIDGKRTLAYFERDHVDPAASGFVKTNFRRGLSPTDFAMMAQAGREGLVHTTVKTSQTGYVQRRIVKALEEASVAYDGTIRDMANNVICFRYGDDGCDGQYMEHLPFRWMGKERFESLVEGISPTERRRLETLLHVVGGHAEMERLDRRTMPFDLSRLRGGGGGASDVGASSCVSDDVPIGDALARMNHICTLQPFHELILRLKWLEEPGFGTDTTVKELCRRWQMAQATPGDLVGVKAAHAIGQPATQMTLNTFHYAGIAAKNVTLGLPRLNQLVDCPKFITTPAASVVVRDGGNRLESAARLRGFTFGDFVLANNTTMTLDVAKLDQVGKCAADWVWALSGLPGGAGRVLECDELSGDVGFVNGEAVSWFEQTAKGQHFCGIDGVEACHLGDDDECVDVACRPKQYSFGELLAHPLVEASQTLSNDVLDVLGVLGIEAACAVLLVEMRKVLSFDGNRIDDRHVKLLIAMMSFTGDLLPVTRHGINNQSSSVLKKCTFEETSVTLIGAAAYGATDSMVGVTENMIFGQSSRSMGTGMCDLVLEQAPFEEMVDSRVKASDMFFR